MQVWKLHIDPDDGSGQLWPLATYSMVAGELSAARIGLGKAHSSQRDRPIGITCLSLERAATGAVEIGADAARQGTGDFVVGTETGLLPVAALAQRRVVAAQHSRVVARARGGAGSAGGVFKCFLNFYKIFDKARL